MCMNKTKTILAQNIKYTCRSSRFFDHPILNSKHCQEWSHQDDHVVDEWIFEWELYLDIFLDSKSKHRYPIETNRWHLGRISLINDRSGYHDRSEESILCCWYPTAGYVSIEWRPGPSYSSDESFACEDFSSSEQVRQPSKWKKFIIVLFIFLRSAVNRFVISCKCRRCLSFMTRFNQWITPIFEAFHNSSLIDSVSPEIESSSNTHYCDRWKAASQLF